MTAMLVRLGIPASFRTFAAAARDLGAAVLVSANALRRRSGGFRTPAADLFAGCDVALDSAGFVAMVRYGGYPWTVEQYVQLAASHPWAWWASMDYCCEPQVARDRDEVRARVDATVRQLMVCREEAGRQGVQMPMPVLQGWEAGDYLRCADLMGDLPELVGLGSVCRRPERGLVGIVDALDQRLPRHVRLHLFGVKGTAMGLLRRHPRIASVDSMAWDFAARKDVDRARGGRFTLAHRLDHMRRWYLAQHAHLARSGWQWQSDLFAGAAA